MNNKILELRLLKKFKEVLQKAGKYYHKNT